ncbi:hypothetical protein RF55_9482 [Lasius niger]|uniref:Uncharacterized protein n=1 Tax=Lasius niger TaxID=67767 RepID=A0A0J7KJD0_LASNI|nr:hypothetical protein RF55_9705 [Lasius niger]KMQ90719.1 hypothetical protein RF55_9493 [Lasius niger]KMQ90727.1 hypothetical protein RF55_9482 [Lasius niger]
MEKEERRVFQPLKRLNRSPTREWEKGIKDDVESAAEERRGSREDIYCMQREERGKERGEDRDLWKEIKILEGRIERQEREVEDMRRELERMKSREDWKKERREWKEKIEELEGRMEVNKWEGGIDKRRQGRERVEMENKVRGMERKLERKEREERLKNVVIRGVKTWKGDLKWGVEQVWKEIGAKVRVQELRKSRTGKEEWGDMVIVKLGSEEQKKEVLRRRKGLKGKKIWIEEDLTWEERRLRWRLREIAREEVEKGRRAWVVQERIRIDGEWWWNKEKEVLLDGMGRSRGKRRGREKNSQIQREVMGGVRREKVGGE